MTNTQEHIAEHVAEHNTAHIAQPKVSEPTTLIQTLKQKKSLIVGLVGVILLAFLVFVINMQNAGELPIIQTGEDQAILQKLPKSEGDGLPPSFGNAPGLATTSGIIVGKYPEDPTALEKPIPVEVSGVLLGLPKTRGVTLDKNYAFLIPEAGEYKGKELTLFVFEIIKKNTVSLPQLYGKRVTLKGLIYRQYVDPAKPKQIQRVVWVNEIGLAEKK